MRIDLMAVGSPTRPLHAHHPFDTREHLLVKQCYGALILAVCGKCFQNSMASRFKTRPYQFRSTSASSLPA